MRSKWQMTLPCFVAVVVVVVVVVLVEFVVILFGEFCWWLQCKPGPQDWPGLTPGNLQVWELVTLVGQELAGFAKGFAKADHGSAENRDGRPLATNFSFGRTWGDNNVVVEQFTSDRKFKCSTSFIFSLRSYSLARTSLGFPAIKSIFSSGSLPVVDFVASAVVTFEGAWQRRNHKDLRRRLRFQ